MLGDRSAGQDPLVVGAAKRVAQRLYRWLRQGQKRCASGVPQRCATAVPVTVRVPLMTGVGGGRDVSLRLAAACFRRSYTGSVPSAPARETKQRRSDSRSAKPAGVDYFWSVETRGELCRCDGCSVQGYKLKVENNK